MSTQKFRSTEKKFLPSTPETSKFRENLNKIIDENYGGNGSKLARESGVDPRRMSDWASGRAHPNAAAVALLAKTTGYSVDALEHGDLVKERSASYEATREADAVAELDPKRIDLINKVKKLALTAEDKTIDALISNVVEFQEKTDAIRRLREIDKK